MSDDEIGKGGGIFLTFSMNSQQRAPSPKEYALDRWRCTYKTHSLSCHALKISRHNLCISHFLPHPVY